MASMKRLANAWLTSLIGVGCWCARADLVEASGPAAGNGAASGERYVLEFSDPPSRGVWVGKFRNLAFRIDLEKTVKKIQVPNGDQRLPDLIATFDYADCTKGQESLLERPLRGLEPGAAAWGGRSRSRPRPVRATRAPMDRGRLLRVSRGRREVALEPGLDATDPRFRHQSRAGADRSEARSDRCRQARVRLRGATDVRFQCQLHYASDRPQP